MEYITVQNDKNLGTMQNAWFLARRRFDVPGITRAFFLQIADHEHSRTPAPPLDGLPDEVATKYVPAREMAQRVPDVVAERVRINGGPEHVIVDLTNGTKQMSCVLYAAASFIRVQHLLFVWVAEAARSKQPSDIADTEFNIDVLRPIDISNAISSAGLVEILYFREMFADCLNKVATGTLTSKLLRLEIVNMLDRAVVDYFHKRYDSCRITLGKLSEELIQELCLALRRKVPAQFHGPAPISPNEASSEFRRTFAQPLLEKMTTDPNNDRGTVGPELWQFRHLVPIGAVFEVLRPLRNFASHPYLDFQEEQDARMALHSMLYVLEMVARSGVLK